MTDATPTPPPTSVVATTTTTTTTNGSRVPDVVTTVTSIKPSWRTAEAWAAGFVLAVLAMLTARGVINPSGTSALDLSASILGMAITSAGLSISRGNAKSNVGGPS